ncbi:MAG: SDR family NAD(P)-dependent oxidoreductase [Dehalococcoidia bacterium]
MSTDAVRGPGREISLEGKIALITGGTRNIGLEVARAFASAGAAGVLTGQREGEHLASIAAELRRSHGQWHGLALDLADPAQIDATIDRVLQEFGRVDVLANVAAIRPHAALTEITVDDWDRVMAVNVRAPFLLAQRLLPLMMEAGWGRIINVSGIDALWGKRDRAHVSTSKSAIDGLSRVLATEAGDSGVTVNTVMPGTIDTEREPRSWWPDLDNFYGLRIDRIPMGRLGKPAEIADVCLFLASDMSSYMTGQTLVVSGGAFPMVKRE